jgi:DNA-binding IclR family transcriptional regulator
LDERYAIRSVDRAVDILECIAAQNGVLNVDQIAAATGLPKTTAFRVLATLAARRLIERDAESQTYRLGGLALVIGARAMGDLDLRRSARPHLEQLLAETGETVHLSLLSEDKALCIDKLDASRAMRMASFIGFLDPLHCSGVGKALLAFQDEPARSALLGRLRLDAHTPHTITDRAGLVAQIEAPVRDHSGGVVAAVSISGPTTRVTEAAISDIAQAVTRCAAAISRDFGAQKVSSA